jgi:hypothetical protein
MKTLQETYFRENLIAEMPQHTDFDKWVEANGGIEGVMSMYDVDLDDTFNFMRDEFEDDEEGQQEYEKEALGRFKEEMEMAFDDWIASYAQDFPLELYRAICVNSIEDINFDAVGIYWTDVYESAECYYGQGEGEQYTIKALAQDKNIDWDTTLNQNMHPRLGEDEREYTLKEGTKIKIIGVEDPDENFIEMERIATI